MYDPHTQSFVYDPHIKPNILQSALQLRSEQFYARTVAIKIWLQKTYSLTPTINNIPVKPRCSNTLLGSPRKSMPQLNSAQCIND